MIPFSSEKLSEGRPSMFHCLMRTGLPRTLTSEKFYDLGISLFFVYSTHSSIIELLNAAVKAPKYAI